jgi:hypothetical protein
MLNLIMTHSPRMAAMTTNKRYGEDAVKNQMVLHRLAIRMLRDQRADESKPATAEQLREQTA